MRAAIGSGSNLLRSSTVSKATGNGVLRNMPLSQSSVALLCGCLQIACADFQAKSGQSRRIARGMRSYGACRALGTPMRTSPLRPEPSRGQLHCDGGPKGKPHNHYWAETQFLDEGRKLVDVPIEIIRT
jgi:hypothetical protein